MSDTTDRDTMLSVYLSNLNMPSMYEVAMNGTYKKSSAENGEERKEKLFPSPVLPTAIFNNLDTETEKVEISFLYHGKWRSIITDRSRISTTANIVDLSNKGLPVDSSTAKGMVQYLNKLINGSVGKLPFSDSRSHLGWTESGFMPFTDDVTFDGDASFRSVEKRIHEKGDIESWRAYIAPLRRSLPLRMMLAASFASPIIEKVGENPFVLHLHGKTGLAKTVSLMVAMSVWGDPAPGGLVRTLNMTVNSMLSTAAFLNNIPFAGDELQTIKNKFDSYDKLIMCITEGIDRGRMSYNSLNEIKTWRCAFITTGEEPCVSPNSGGGVKNRVIQIECDTPIIGSGVSGNTVANFVRNNYGTAAKPYIERLAEIDLQTEYDKIYADIINSGTNTTNKQAGAMSMLLLADRISTELFFPEQKPLKFADVRHFLFTEEEIDVAERAYHFVCDKVSENVSMFAKDARVCWGKLDTINGYCMMNKTVLEKILRDESYDFDAVKRGWSKKGYIVQQGHGFRWNARINDVLTSCIKIVLPTEEPPEPSKPEPPQAEPTTAEDENIIAEYEQEIFDIF